MPDTQKRPKTGFETEPTEQLLETLAGLPNGPARTDVETELQLRGELPDPPPGPWNKQDEKAGKTDPASNETELLYATNLGSPPPGIVKTLRVLGWLSISAGVFYCLLGLVASEFIGKGAFTIGFQGIFSGYLLMAVSKGVEILWETRCMAKATLEMQMAQTKKP